MKRGRQIEKLAAAAMAAIALLLGSNARAQTARATLVSSVTVVSSAREETVYQATTFRVTPEDIRRGYVNVNGATVIPKAMSTNGRRRT